MQKLLLVYYYTSKFSTEKCFSGAKFPAKLEVALYKYNFCQSLRISRNQTRLFYGRLRADGEEFVKCTPQKFFQVQRQLER